MYATTAYTVQKPPWTIELASSCSQFHTSYKFSRSASAAAAPTIGDVRMLNKVVRTVRANPVRLHFWPLKGQQRTTGYPDASYRNNEDQPSQRGQTSFVAEARKAGRPHSRGSMIDNESTDPSHNLEHDSVRALQLHEVLWLMSVHERFVDGH